MTAISTEQRLFLERHRICLSRVFDASGLAHGEYKKIMKDLGKLAAVGVTPCGAALHTLRSRHGHCLQCQPQCIAFIKRCEDPGKVYVARSVALGLLKIGTTLDTSLRMQQLNRHGYGGSNDWQTVFECECLAAGRVELAAQALLANYSAYCEYNEQGVTRQCYELFACDEAAAVNAVLCGMRTPM